MQQTSPPRRILLIEDDRDIAHLVQLHLQDSGYDVILAHDGVIGLQRALSEPFDLVILDLTLPRLDGLEICRRLRAREGYTLILMLTSRSSEAERVSGLELGADDYLTKPFGIRELVARVNALFRRQDVKGPQDCPAEEYGGEKMLIHAGDLTIEREKHRVTLEAIPVNLTVKEFDLLVQFACHPGRVYSRTQLLDLIWGHGYEGYEHTVNSHINRLRTKIEKDPAHPLYLLTVWGVGYKFADGLERQKA